jgi:hypothetical protein
MLSMPLTGSPGHDAPYADAPAESTPAGYEQTQSWYRQQAELAAANANAGQPRVPGGVQ